MDEAAAARVATALTDLVTDHGRSVLTHPERLRAGLADLLGADAPTVTRYVDALVTLAAAGQAADLSTAEPDLAGVTDSIRRLRPALDPESALWAARTVHSLIGPPPQDQTRFGLPAEPTRLTQAPQTYRVSQGQVAAPAARPSRTRVLVSAAALIAVAAASVGITYAATRPSDTGTAATAANLAGLGAVSQVPAGSTHTITKVSPTTVVRSVTSVQLVTSTVDASANHVRLLCTPGGDAIDSARTAINLWAGASNSDSAVARTAATRLTAAANTIDQALTKVTGPADSGLTVTAGLVAAAQRDLAGILGLAGGSGYDSANWNAAVARWSLLTFGFSQQCQADPGSPVQADRAAVQQACGKLLPPMRAADAALRGWLAAPGSATAKAFAAQAETVNQAAGAVRWGVLYTSAFGRAVDALDDYRYFLWSAATKAPTEKPADRWVTGWSASRDAVLRACA